MSNSRRLEAGTDSSNEENGERTRTAGTLAPLGHSRKERQ